MFALKYVAVLAVAAASATAADVTSPEMKTDEANIVFRVPREKDLRVERSVEQSASLFGVMQQVEALAQKAKVSDALLTTLPYVGDSIKRIDTLVKDTATVTASFKTIRQDMDQVAKDAKAASASQTDTLNKEITALKKTNSDQANKITEDQKTFKAAVDKSVKEKLAAIEEKMAKLTKDTAASIAKGSDTKANSVTPMWVGGHVGGHLRGGGWFNMGRLDFHNAPNHLKRNSYQIEVLHTGIYNMHARILAHGGWQHCHYRFRIDNKYITSSTHDWLPGTWDHVELEETFVVKKGQKISLRTDGCNYAIHGSGQNQYDVHNRIAIKFVGEIDSKCTGPFCKGI